MKVSMLEGDWRIYAYTSVTVPAKDGCDEDMPDTEERQKAWIAGLQAAGECTCDEEHSFVCPKDPENAGKQEEASQLGDVIDSILAGKVMWNFVIPVNVICDAQCGQCCS